MRIMLPVPARFLLATLCCLSLHTATQADAAGPTPTAAEPSVARAEALSKRGIAAYDAGQFADALRYFDEAYRLDPNDASILMLRGGTYKELGRCKEAIADFDAFEKQHNHIADYLLMGDVFRDRAYCRMQLKDYEAAAGDLEEQVRFKPDDDWAWATLGRAYSFLKRHEESEAALKRAIKLNPDDPYANYQLGLVYMGTLRSREAIPYLQTTVRLEPGNKDAKYLLDAAVAETSGKPATAAGSQAAAPSSGAQPTQAPTSQSRTPVAGSAAPITITDGMAIGRGGVRSSLVRIPAPSSKPYVFYVDEASRRQTGQKDIVAIWVLQVWPNGNPSDAKVSAVWTEFNANCKLNSYEVTRGILLDRQAKVLSDDAMNGRGTSDKDLTRETPSTIACKTVTPSKGPRFASATAAIADAISGASQNTPTAAAAQAPPATSTAKPASANVQGRRGPARRRHRRERRARHPGARRFAINGR